MFQTFHLLLILLDLVDELPLTFPLGTELCLLFAQFGDVLVELGYLGLVALAFDGLTLDLKLCQTAGDLIQFLRHGVTLHPQLGSSLVHQVDGLVRQEAF